MADWRRRSRELTTQYNQGKQAFDQANYIEAISVFSDLQSKEPGFADTGSLLERARTTIRSGAESVFNEAYRRDTQGDLVGALNGYREAQRIDSSYDPAARAIASVQERIRTFGDELMRRATAEDAFGRVAPAVVLYKRVVELLAEGDPNRIKAEQRIEALQGARP